MATPLKEQLLTAHTMDAFASILARSYRGFRRKAFLAAVFSPVWDGLELKDRMHHATRCMAERLPKDYRKALDVLEKAAPEIQGMEAMCLPDFVEIFGQDDWDRSLPALALFTKYSSSEFAIRPFLREDPQRGMAFMAALADDPDENVRRFASEGCRPRLPWAGALPAFKKDPALILPVLEKLKVDPSESVRRSVANNLNDISKDNPETMLDLCESWYGEEKNTDWIVRHACRSLLKAGDPRAMVLLGFCDPKNIDLLDLGPRKKKVRIGQDTKLLVELRLKGKKARKARIDYAIDYVKKNGKLSRKVFVLFEGALQPGPRKLERKISLADMSTRKHYPGEHRITLLVNGTEKGSTALELVR